MKTILVPTDFSAGAANATEYALQLAIDFGASITLLHAFHIPVNVTEVPITLTNTDELFAINKESLNKVAHDLRTKVNAGVEVNTICKMGFAVDEILDTADEIHADLIIMGMHGTSGVMAEMVGSITTTVMHKSKLPIMAIPENFHYRQPKKIVLAVGGHFPASPGSLAMLTEFANRFKSELNLVNVKQDEGQHPDFKMGSIMENNFKGINCHYDEVVNAEIETGIKNFAADKEADLITVIPQEYSFWHTLFNPSTTKHLAFHTSLPLLSIHHRN
ncbi:MAG: universal stress protein [Bacteroidetes bacterium]|nr:universal stress protein [Bacteroidota bacterium]